MKPTGPAGVRAMSHRAYVGGHWNLIGNLAFDFLKGRGVTPQDTVLDIGCGSLRVGRHLIPWLEPGHYLGIDAEEDLIVAGIGHEIAPETLLEKKPEFVISSDFAFDAFDANPTVALAQSLFTHLAPDDILQCLGNLARVLDGPLYATFHRCFAPRVNPLESHMHARFEYSLEGMSGLAERTGWKTELIGPWGHPRRQQMLCFRR